MQLAASFFSHCQFLPWACKLHLNTKGKSVRWVIIALCCPWGNNVSVFNRLTHWGIKPLGGSLCETFLLRKTANSVTAKLVVKNHCAPDPTSRVSNRWTRTAHKELLVHCRDDQNYKDYLPGSGCQWKLPSQPRHSICCVWMLEENETASVAFSSSFCCSLLPVPLWKLQSFPLLSAVYALLWHTQDLLILSLKQKRNSAQGDRGAEQT